jgi:hypothetical protein
MSLHKFADMVAKQGRGEDSLLIHMTPDEVQRLQKFAEANGRSLTINPDTGLPEAGMLSDLFKAVAPIALGAFLGPGAFGIAGMGLSAGTAGLITGGLTTLATGSLSRGLMAGLGAYGGAGLAEGLAGTGAGILGQQASEATAMELANAGASEGLTGEAYNKAFQQSVTDKMAGANTFSAGLNAAKADPMQFAKDNFKYLGAAAAPIMAGAMVPTTTKMPENNSPAYIRQKLYDPYTQTYKTLAPVKASEWGSRSFSDAYTNPQTGEMATLQPRAPSGMAGGGIVALAIGGEAKTALEDAYAKNDVDAINRIVSENKITAEDVGSTWKGFDTSGIAGLNLYTPPAAVDTADAGGGGGGGGGGIQNLTSTATTPYYFQNNADVAAEFARNPMGMTADQFAQTHYDKFGKSEGREFAPSAAATYAKANNLDLVSNTEKWINDNPFATPDQISAAITGSGMSKQDVTRSLDALVASGKISAADRYYIQQGKGLSGMADNSAKWLKDNANATQTQIDAVLKAAGMNTGDAQQVLAHGFQVANDQMAAAAKYIQDNPDVARWITSAQGQAYVKEHPEFDAKDIAFTHYKRYGEKEGRKWGLDKKVDTKTGAGGVGGVGGPPTTTVLPTNPQTNAPPGTRNPYGNVNNPGDLTFNNDGSITVQPNIPGRPYGGFSGMDEVKNAYTAGGGSLGYIPKAPQTMDEFNTMFNRQTGDSMAAYEYLMGKAGAKYPVQSTAASGAQGIMRPYWSAGMKYKPKFLSYDKDGTIKSSSTSGGEASDAKPADLTKAQTIEVTDSSGEATQTYTAVLQKDGTYLAGNGKRYDVTGKELAADGGMMGYAMGGGLGSLGGYSDGGRLLKGPGDGVSDSIPATIGAKRQPARLADGEFVIPARIVSELGNGSTEAGAKKLYAMMDRVQKARGKTTGKNKVAANSRADKHLPA